MTKRYFEFSLGKQTCPTSDPSIDQARLPAASCCEHTKRWFILPILTLGADKGYDVTSGATGDQFHRDHRGPGDHAMIRGQISPLLAVAMKPRQEGARRWTVVDVLPRVGAVRSSV